MECGRANEDMTSLFANLCSSGDEQFFCAANFRISFATFACLLVICNDWIYKFYHWKVEASLRRKLFFIQIQQKKKDAFSLRPYNLIRVSFLSSFHKYLSFSYFYFCVNLLVMCHWGDIKKGFRQSFDDYASFCPSFSFAALLFLLFFL